MVPLSQTCLLATHKISKIAAPLFNATGLNFFSYARDFNDNMSFSLQTDIELYLAWYESQSPYCSHLVTEGTYSSDIIQNSKLQEMSKQLNYGNGIHIFKRQPTFTEVITFAAPVDSMNVLQLYVNNMSLFNRFVMYFKEKAKDIITQAANDPITVPDFMIQKEATQQDNSNIKTFEQSTKINTFYFEDETGVKLSNRELECLNHYIKGLSTSQIAQLMNVKKITADTFMKNVKQKFQCGSKSQLFDKLWKLGIIQTSGVLG